MATHKDFEELQSQSFAAAKKRFDEVNKKSQEIIEEYITQGYLETLANLIVYLGPEKAQTVLEKLPELVKNGVEKHLAEKKGDGKSFSRTDPEVIVDAGYVFKKSGWYGEEMSEEFLRNPTPMEYTGFKMNYNTFLELNPILAMNIDYYIFVFDDLASLDDRAIQKILRETDQQELALALKGAEVEVQDKIFSNMSRRAAGMLKEDIEFMGPVRLCDVEAAQQRILSIAKQLEANGDIIIFKDN